MSTKEKVETLEIQNISAEIYRRVTFDRDGNERVYFDIDFLRCYWKGEEKVITKSFQFKDLDKLIATIALARDKVSELLRELKFDRKDEEII